MPRKNHKHLPDTVKALIPTLTICLGIALMLFNGAHSILRDKALALSQHVVAQYETQPNRGARPVKISIQPLVETTIVEAPYQEGVWTVAPNEATYLAQSARPGQKGNIIIYGHNTRSILGNIRWLKGGETITLTTEDGGIHEYIVKNRVEVDPERTEFLQPSPSELLTIYTCSGLMDKKRFIIQAVPADSLTAQVLP